MQTRTLSATDRVEAGTVLTYTLVVANEGGEVDGVVVSDTLPAHTSFSWASESGYLDGGNAMWDGLSLAAGEQLTLTLGVTVACVPSGTEIANTQSVVYATEWPTPTWGNAIRTNAAQDGVSAAFTTTAVVVGWPVAFSDESVNATTYRWTFGDGGSSSERNPTHTYGAVGSYQVVLTASNLCEYAVVSRTLRVDDYDVVASAAQAGIAADPGDMVTHTLRVTNAGTISDTFVLAVDAAWQTAVSPPAAWLAPGEGVTVSVAVTVPGDALAGEWDRAQVSAVPTSDPRTPPASAHVAFTTTANAVYDLDLSAEVDALGGLSGETVTYTLRVENRGNALDRVSFARVNPGWPTALSVNEMDIARGGWRKVYVYVTVPVTASGGNTDMAIIRAVGLGDSVDLSLDTTAVWWRAYLPLITLRWQAGP